ncbi:hypothetical protein LLG95_16165 [bacterium]|nr:hypothetical protein [bacterium]
MDARSLINRSHKQNLIIFSFVFFGCYLGFAWIAFRDILPFDLSQKLMMTLNGVPYVPMGRASLEIVQWPALLAVKAGWSLESIARIQVMTNVLLYFAAFVVMLFALRQITIALAVPVFLTVGMGRIFYAPFESTLCVVGAILFFVVLERALELSGRRRWVMIAAGALLSWFLYFLYPLSIIYGPFMIAFSAIRNRRIAPAHVAMALVFCAYVGWRLMHSNSYDQGRVKWELAGADAAYLSKLAIYLIRNQGIYLAAWIVSVAVCFRRREWLAGAFILLFFIGYLGLVNVTTSLDKHAPIYLAHTYESLAPLVLIPFFSHTIDRMPRRLSVPLGLLFVLVVTAGMANIIAWRSVYRARMDTCMRILHAPDLAGKRFVRIDERNLNMGEKTINWSLPLETILQTTMDDPGDTRAMFITEYQRNLNVLTPDLVTPQYFRIPLGTPEQVNTAASQELWKKGFAVRTEIKAALPEEMDAGEKRLVDATIVNRNRTRIQSAFRPKYSVEIAGRWSKLDESGNPVSSKIQPVYTPLEIDVTTSYTQPIAIQAPREEGSYWLELGFLVNRVDFYSKSRQTVRLR